MLSEGYADPLEQTDSELQSEAIWSLRMLRDTEEGGFRPSLPSLYALARAKDGTIPLPENPDGLGYQLIAEAKAPSEASPTPEPEMASTPSNLDHPEYDFHRADGPTQPFGITPGYVTVKPSPTPTATDSTDEFRLRNARFIDSESRGVASNGSAITNNPFSDLIPPDFIGGENGAPAFQTIGARFEQVPRASLVTPNAFADLIPGQPDPGAFHDLIPPPPPQADLTSATEQAVSESAFNPRNEQISSEPTFMGELQSGNIHNAYRLAKDFLGQTLEPTQKIEPGRGQGLLGTEEQIPAHPDDSLMTRAAKAVVNVTNRTAAGLSGPGMLPLAVIGGAGGATGRLLSAGFGATVAANVSEVIQNIVEKNKANPMSQEAIEADLDGAVTALMLGGAAKGARGEPAPVTEMPPVPETAAEQPLPQDRSGSSNESPLEPLSAGEPSFLEPASASLEAARLPQEPQSLSEPQLDITPPAPPVQPEGWQMPENIEPGTTAAIAELNRQLGPETRVDVEPLRQDTPSPAPEILSSRTSPDEGNDWTQATAEPVKKTRQYNTPDGGYSEHPLVQFIQGDLGGIMSKSTAKRKLGKAKFTENQSLWEDAPHFTDPRQNKVYDARSGQSPDAVATAAADAGLLPNGADASALWAELEKIAKSSSGIAKEEWQQAKLGREAEKMAKAEPAEPDWSVPKLRRGEKQGDIFSNLTEDLTLAGEKGVDYGARQAAAERATKEAEAARALQDQQQGRLEDHAQKLKLKADKEGGFVNADLLREAAAFGHRLYERGIRFGEWSAEMVRHLGGKIREHLSGIWDTIQRVTGDERGSIGGNIGLNIKGKRTHLNAATTARSAKLQKSFADAERAQKEIGRVARSERERNAMSVWREAGGDATLLKQQIAAAKTKWFKKAATDALALKPEQIKMVGKVGQTFDVLERRGRTYDVLNSHRDNYVPHMWDVSKKLTGIGSSKLKDRFKFSKARTLDTFFDGDQAKMTPKTLDIGKLLPAYLHEMNTVIADRQFAQDVSSGVSSEGTPLTIPSGNARVVEATEYVVSPVKKFEKSVYDTAAEAQAALKPGQTVTPRRAATTTVNPRGFAKAVDAAGNPIDQSSYKSVDQPALTNWRWVASDAAGNTTILKGDLKAHPELAKRLNSMMGQSAVRQWYNEPSTALSVIPKAIAKGLDTAQATMKREMFGALAPFHQVQEGTHAVGHLVNPTFGLENMSRPTPAHIDAMQHGLMLLPEKQSSAAYIEGVGGRNTFLTQLSRKFGGKAGAVAADVVDGYQNYLFHQYIPALKFKTYEHILARNMSRYAKEIANGEVMPADVKFLSAEQSNAAYGHLNYALLDRNPTMQHLIQIVALAPDFLEARGRFVGQALKGFASKSGHEQFRAIATLAAVQAGSAIVISSLMGDKWDPKHPFEVTHNGRTYTLRSVPEDLFRLLFSGPDTRREFVRARVNPLTGMGWQAVTGRNYRGEKVGFWDTVGETLANYIPITARSIPFVRNLTESGRNYPVSPLEQLMGSLGLKISRYSPITKTYQLASEYKKANGIPADTGVYPVSKYQSLRYALEDADMDRAKVEYQKLRSLGMTSDKIRTGFQESINHPFTGTKASDEKFKKSLAPEARESYDQAVARRREILRKFGFVTR